MATVKEPPICMFWAALPVQALISSLIEPGLKLLARLHDHTNT
jgi:hypothetical protein